MRRLFILVIFHFIVLPAIGQPTQDELSRWKKTASDVTIIRDQWGIPHVYGRTDADAVFGLMFAQCEDDFPRVERNYIEKLGRISEIEGEKYIYQDLYIRLVIDEEEAKKDYQRGPVWLTKLLDAFADGLNFYLYTHPGVKPKLLTHFEPWYPLLWTDGSIGAISTGFLTSDDVKEFYTGERRVGKTTFNTHSDYENMDGSNGFAISGTRTESGNAMLYINPHVSLYFRPEVHVSSEEGLNSYGAVTWGQFYIYQGFNELNGWMHTSSDADVSDLYSEKISSKGNTFFYEYEGHTRPLKTRDYVIAYKADNVFKEEKITTYSTHHGPVMGQRGSYWLTVKANNRSMDGIIQSWLRMKTKGFDDYKKLMKIRANTSNNTVYADNKGNIAYWHGNFMPKRNPSYSWGKAVDGTTSATEWQGLHSVDETVHLYNPPNGWIQNCNSTPFTAAGPNSPDRSLYPLYMAPDAENYRGINAVRVLNEHSSKFTIESLITAGYDRRLAAFEDLIPPLTKAYDDLPSSDTLKNFLSKPIQLLRDWDFRCSEESVATTLAIHWAQMLIPKMSVATDEDQYEWLDQITRTRQFVRTTDAKELVATFVTALNQLSKDLGKWQIPWGEINRYQRISSDINNKFADSEGSLAVGFASSAWGALPSYSSRTFPNTKKRYCTGGNSFVCAVEFGPKIKAKSLLAGGESGNASSPHFFDQGKMYAKGIFKDVLFYKEDVLRHAQRTYHPGE